jgi:hypothetical protein
LSIPVTPPECVAWFQSCRAPPWWWALTGCWLKCTRRRIKPRATATVFRLPEGTAIEPAQRSLAEAIKRAGPNREKIRDQMASGTPVGGVSFVSTGELGRSSVTAAKK